MAKRTISAEERRMELDRSRKENWSRWGTYLPERQWGTVREDYSDNGDYWRSFPFDHAGSRAYRWGEDGLLGWTDRECRLCFSLALWNGKDPILKERLFGLSNPEGNHGEDVKECYYYLDNTPTHSYAKALYKYPQAEFPYRRLVEENARRSRQQTEFEIFDTGVFDESRYFDVVIEYAKASPGDTCIRVSLTNRGPDTAHLHVLPTVWFRNTWRGASGYERLWSEPFAEKVSSTEVLCSQQTLGQVLFAADEAANGPAELLFTDNETNQQRYFGVPNTVPFTKDGLSEYVIGGRKEAVNPQARGSKAAFSYAMDLSPGQTKVLHLRLFEQNSRPVELFGESFNQTFMDRMMEAVKFYAGALPRELKGDGRAIVRQALANLLWSKQFYYYVVTDWAKGDPGQPPPPPHHAATRNEDWTHVFDRNVLSMPDKWEYPWFAAWDLAFQMPPFCLVDPEFAKDQLVLLLREWFMHPSGALPAYEGSFSDVNPPVHAWACRRVYQMSSQAQPDKHFLSRSFQKLLMNFTWWVNRKDPTGQQIFSGGFLGMDNIGVFDRSKPLPSGQYLEEADGTAWMAFYSITMMAIALELSDRSAAYEDLASKFFMHFISIADAMNTLGGSGLWDEQDGFYYDQILINGEPTRLKVRSLVGLIPLLAVEVLEDASIRDLPGFTNRMQWFLDNRRDLFQQISYMESRPVSATCTRRLLAIPSRERLVRVLRYMLDENEFLSPFGIRSLSKFHQDHPYTFHDNGESHTVAYEPGESQTQLFGGNSNWRGPIWMPMNFLLLEALQKYHHFYGDELKVECPTGSGKMLNLRQVACDISHRLCRIFLLDGNGQRPWAGGNKLYAQDPNWRDLMCFHEYFHAETGQGLGASHQAGWTALIVHLLETVSREWDHAGCCPK